MAFNPIPMLSVAPMIDWTDRHCRYFHRLLAPKAELYTEMIVDKALIHGDAAALLAGARDGVVVQLGGSEPEEMRAATAITVAHGYDAVNLNCGCPSDRVQSGAFGAVLMKDIDRVLRLLDAMRAGGAVRASIKLRLGVDDQNAAETFPKFIGALDRAGVDAVIIHARKAWLEGLSPKENREIPPLDYDLAAAMVAEFPRIRFAINGGITDLGQAEALCARGFVQAMIGRAAYQRPFDILAGSNPNPPSREAVIDAMAGYIDAHIAKGGRAHQVTRHMLGLYHGVAGGRAWRQMLSTQAVRADASGELLRQAMPVRVAF